MGVVVLTVHDMIHEIFADQVDPTGTEAEIKRKAINSADAIIAFPKIPKWTCWSDIRSRKKE